jgi:hypothetical protein
MGSRCSRLGREVVKYDVATDFYCPPSTVRTGYPDEVAFRILGIAQEAAWLSAWIELGQRVGYDASCARGAEGANVGEIGLISMPKLEWSLMWWQGGVWHAVF